MLLQNKTAVVTGCNRGIGKKILEVFSANGATVFACVRRKDDQFQNYIEVLKKKFNNEIIPIEFDLGDENQVKESANNILLQKSPIDILVNAAGIVDRLHASELSEEDWLYTLDVNLTGTFLVTKAVGERMILRKSGSIINIGTFLGDRGHRFARSAYNASKAGVVSLSRSLSIEWGSKGIRVNCISPGAHRTPMMGEAAFDEKNLEYLREKTVLVRVGEPEDITGLCVFLASDASSYVTGVNVYEDGGGWL